MNENPGDASDASDVPDDVPEGPESAGTDLGELDGCQALFENEGVATLNYGTDSYTEDDCPVGGTSTAPSSSAKPKTSNSGSSTRSESLAGADTK